MVFLIMEEIVIVVQSLSCVRLFATLWTAARQASLSLSLPEFAQTYVHWGKCCLKI